MADGFVDWPPLARWLALRGPGGCGLPEVPLVAQTWHQRAHLLDRVSGDVCKDDSLACWCNRADAAPRVNYHCVTKRAPIAGVPSGLIGSYDPTL